MKWCNRVLFAVLAASVSLVCGCGSKTNSQEKAAAPAAPKKEAVATPPSVAKRESAVATSAVPKKETTVAAREVPKTQSADPAWLSDIKLQGIGGTSTRRLAIINGKTLGPGQGIQVKAGGKIVILRCFDVKEKTVTVEIEGLEGERELRLN